MKRKSYTTRYSRAAGLSALRARVFHGPAGRDDERRFKSLVHLWVITPTSSREGWEQWIDTMILKVNKGGDTLKYCTYNHAEQRFVPELAFTYWANALRNEIVKQLTKFYAGQR